MGAVALIALAMGALVVAATTAWMVARDFAGGMSRTGFKEHQAIFPWVIGGVLAVAVALVIRHDGAAWLILVAFALGGALAGGAGGWLTRDPQERE